MSNILYRRVGQIYGRVGQKIARPKATTIPHVVTQV